MRESGVKALISREIKKKRPPPRFCGPEVSTSDFQSEVGEVFGEIGGELPAKFGRRFSSFFCWGKSSEAFSTTTPPQISPSNFTTRFWVVAGPTEGMFQGWGRGVHILKPPAGGILCAPPPPSLYTPPTPRRVFSGTPWKLKPGFINRVLVGNF